MTEPTPTSRRAVRETSRRARTRRQRRSLLGAIVGVLGMTVLGVSAAGGTYALLTASASAPGTTITAGNASLVVAGPAGVTLDAAALDPKTESRILFTVSNTGDVPLALTSALAVTTSPAPAISQNVRIAVASVTNATSCSRTDAPSTPRVSISAWNTQATTLGTIPVGATTQMYCLMIGLDANTPATQSGQSFTYTLTINGRQATP